MVFLYFHRISVDKFQPCNKNLFVLLFCWDRMRGYGDTGGRTSSRRITPSGDSNIFSCLCISVCIRVCILQNCKKYFQTHGGLQKMRITLTGDPNFFLFLFTFVVFFVAKLQLIYIYIRGNLACVFMLWLCLYY